MAKLSLYTTGYDEVKKDLPWDFWTDEEKSWVINQGYERFMLKSDELKSYLRSSRLLTITNALVPMATLFASYAFFKRSAHVGLTIARRQ
jgi:hypothetical protein